MAGRLAGTIMAATMTCQAPRKSGIGDPGRRPGLDERVMVERRGHAGRLEATSVVQATADQQERDHELATREPIDPAASSTTPGP